MKRYSQYMYSYPHKTAYRFLEGVSWKEAVRGLGRQKAGEKKEKGLYMHIPFCEQKCGYCNLFSVTGQSEAYMDVYLTTMEMQLKAYQRLWEEEGQPPVFNSLTVGGGTPLLLTEKQLERLFANTERAVSFSKERDCVIETSPNQTTKEKLQILKQFGVRRVSIGVQSFQEEELRCLHRSHTAERARKALDWLKEANFPCLNLDLIYGIPHQSLSSLEDSVRQALAFAPDEIFAYPLYIKRGVWLEGREQMEEEKAYQQYLLLQELLLAAGYRQDSMRRFVRSREPISFMECGFSDTLSVGCGGRSYLGNLHVCTPYAVKQGHCLSILEAYCKEPVKWDKPFGYLLSKEEEKRRYVIKHLLFGAGINREAYQRHFSAVVEEEFPELLSWKKLSYVEESASYFRLSKMGLSYSDMLGPLLISQEVREKMEAWRESGL